MSSAEVKKIILELIGRDRIELEISNDGKIQSLQVLGCHELQSELQKYVSNQGLNIKSWSLPTSHDHGSLLIKELILKAKNEWNFPVLEKELCHCRNVNTDIVDMCIVAGARDAEAVSRQTAASTGCGTCRKDIERILAYRLNLGT